MCTMNPVSYNHDQTNWGITCSIGFTSFESQMMYQSIDLQKGKKAKVTVT